VVGWSVGEDAVQPRAEPFEVLVTDGEDFGGDEQFAEVVDGLGLRLLVEQVVGNQVAGQGRGATTSRIGCVRPRERCLGSPQQMASSSDRGWSATPLMSGGRWPVR
jgi:hypothetical protein